MRLTGAVVASLAIALLGATHDAPELTLHMPWIVVDTPIGQGEEKPVAEWALPNGLPNPAVENTQFVEVATQTLDPGGLGGYVANRIATLDPKYVSQLHYAPIDTCLRRAWLFTFDDTFTGGKRSFEVAYVAVGETLYIANYSRPFDQPENADAHAAIVDFCNTHRAPTT